MIWKRGRRRAGHSTSVRYLAMKVPLRGHAHPSATLCITAIAVVAWALATSVAAGEEPTTKYVMSFDRPGAVGNRYKFTCSYKLKQKATFGGPEKREPWNRVLIANCEGIRATLATDKNGKSTKISLAIDQFTYQFDDGPKQTIPQGATITSELKDGKTVFAMNGADVPEDVHDFLRQFLLPGANLVSADERFGTKLPRAVGEEWPMNASATAAGFAAAGSHVDEKNIVGTVKLGGVSEVEGVECFKIESEYRATNVTEKATKADRSELVSGFHERAVVMLPRDESRTRLRFSLVKERTSQWTWKPKDGSAIPVTETSLLEFDQHSVPVEEAKKR